MTTSQESITHHERVLNQETGWFHDVYRMVSVVLFTMSLLMAGCASEQKSSAAVTERVPLVEAKDTMRPSTVWKNFYDLTLIPRPSHHEAQVTAFVANFGRSLGLETVVDAVGNVIIRKPATSGMELAPGVILQGHLDMVPHKTSTSTHNFETDPLITYVENGWVHADGTTLGADDGIGVSIIMAILRANDIAHGPIEALFTVDEEGDFTGINALEPNTLQGKFLINVDNEDEGQFVISSAGGANVDVNADYEEVLTPVGMTGLQVTINGLLGGHSGVDIDKGRGSAHQLMARLLSNSPAAFGLRLASLAGGDLVNAIPRSTTAIVALPTDQVTAFGVYLSGIGAAVATELVATDPGVSVAVTTANLPTKVMPMPAQLALIKAVYDAPQSMYRMSADVPGMVETSGNLGILSIGNGKFFGGILVRSALDSERDAEAQRFATVFAQAGAATRIYGAFPSWPPDPASPLLALMKQVYTKLFGVAPTVVAIHAGLETSVAKEKYPGIDMISIGPTVQNVHSPDERLEVASVQKAYDLIAATLRQIK